VFDPEGRNIEAVCLRPQFWAEEWGIVGWVLATGVLIAALVGLNWFVVAKALMLI
jgi:hypothetical protein